mmetsp:Transcript_3376/g.5432  ORF Transcript_3376/g.5432 Transcript_3376/m.5432 type:complete len:87 (+) Transcript_3376:61-321(+)
MMSSLCIVTAHRYVHVVFFVYCNYTHLCVCCSIRYAPPPQNKRKIAKREALFCAGCVKSKDHVVQYVIYPKKIKNMCGERPGDSMR